MRASTSLVIPCLDAAASLERVLDGVWRQTRRPDEVLVVDDGSTDDTARIAHRGGARLITHARNMGLAAARNSALNAAGGEVVVFVDADAVPHAELLDRLVQGYDDPGLGGVGGQIMELGQGGVADRWRAAFWRQTQGTAPLPDAPFLVGGCCSLRRAAALDAGGFCDTFSTNGEDVDLSLRLRGAGLRLAYDPRAVVFHLRRDTPRSLLAMVYRHSRDHVQALRGGGESALPVVASALRWGPVTLVSSLRRHSSPTLAGLSLACHGAALWGCSVGWLRGQRTTW